MSESCRVIIQEQDTHAVLKHKYTADSTRQTQYRIEIEIRNCVRNASSKKKQEEFLSSTSV